MCFDLAGYSCLSRSGSGRTVSSSFGLRFVPMNLVRVMFGSVLRDVALACDVAAEGGVRHGCVVLIDEAFPDVTCGNAGVGVEHRVDVSMEPMHGVGTGGLVSWVPAVRMRSVLGEWCGGGGVESRRVQ